MFVRRLSTHAIFLHSKALAMMRGTCSHPRTRRLRLRLRLRYRMRCSRSVGRTEAIVFVRSLLEMLCIAWRQLRGIRDAAPQSLRRADNPCPSTCRFDLCRTVHGTNTTLKTMLHSLQLDPLQQLSPQRYAPRSGARCTAIPPGLAPPVPRSAASG